MRTCRWSANIEFRAWSESMDAQAGLALYLWQRLITFGSQPPH